MTLLDAYALVALAAEEPAAAEVEELLRIGDCRVVAVNLAEAIDVTARVHGVGLEDVRATLEPLLVGGVVRPVEAGAASAWRAAQIRVEHYDRKECAVSLADCFLLAEAAAGDDRLATSDPAVAAVARRLPVEIVALADSSGRRP